MTRVFLAVCLLNILAVPLVNAQPSEEQIAVDATGFHRFRIAALAHAIEIDKQNPGSSAGAKYLGVECRKLALRTSPDYLYGIVEDLIKDTSRTEEPYFIAIMVLDNYPPSPARKVVKQIIDDPKYKACGDAKNWLWEIDEAQNTVRK